MQKHQYRFGIMNGNTGGIRRKSFLGVGATEEECRKDASSQAEQLTDQAYDKACRRDRSGYKPSRCSYQFLVVGCTLWQ